MKIIKAKAAHRIWSLRDTPHNGMPFDIVDVIAWNVGDSAPVPITPHGPHHGPYILSTGAGWIASPEGKTFRDSCDVEMYLRQKEVRA